MYPAVPSSSRGNARRWEPLETAKEMLKGMFLANTHMWQFLVQMESNPHVLLRDLTGSSREPSPDGWAQTHTNWAPAVPWSQLRIAERSPGPHTQGGTRWFCSPGFGVQGRSRGESFGISYYCIGLLGGKAASSFGLSERGWRCFWAVSRTEYSLRTWVLREAE